MKYVFDIDGTICTLSDGVYEKASPIYSRIDVINELYADVFSRTYGIETIGLRYFNVFGRRQDPNGAYAAVIPKFLYAIV